MAVLHFFKSFLYIIGLIFNSKSVDIIFYYPQHFNRGKNAENLFFKHLIRTCNTSNISYLVFEEPDYSSDRKRNPKNIPFDFLFLFVIFLRKLLSSKLSVIEKDNKIGGFLSKSLLARLHFKHVITISQSMVSLFRGLNPDCKIFDLQHGIIYNNKKDYVQNNKVECNLLDNDVNLLLNGEAFKDLLIANDDSAFFKKNISVIGGHVSKSTPIHTQFNNNILVTLQFTHDHTQLDNQCLYKYLKQFIRSTDGDINFYLKQHPRYNNEIDISSVLSLKNVHAAPEDIPDCFQLCSLHLTAYSTSTFEAALCGIPTIFVNPLKRYDYFRLDFNYPLQHLIDDFKDESLYSSSSKIVQEWASNYYLPYNEQQFLNAIR